MLFTFDLQKQDSSHSIREIEILSTKEDKKKKKKQSKEKIRKNKPMVGYSNDSNDNSNISFTCVIRCLLKS